MNNNELMNVMSKVTKLEREFIDMIHRKARKKDLVAMVYKLADLNRELCTQLMNEDEYDYSNDRKEETVLLSFMNGKGSLL